MNASLLSEHTIAFPNTSSTSTSTLNPDDEDGGVVLLLPSLNSSTFRGIVNGYILNIMTIINIAIGCAVLFVFGSIVNTINIIVFVKIGFKDPVNISLFLLSISDLGCCFSLFMFALCFNPFFRQLDLPFDPNNSQFYSGWIHIIFSRITSLITAFITFERCLCVAAPLKVKEIITPKRVVVFLTCTVVMVIAIFSPHFYTSEYIWKFIPARNKSILVLNFIENSKEIDDKITIVHSIILPFSSFFVVVVSTIVLVLNLKAKTKWRENVTGKSSSTATGSSSSSSNLSSRDVKVSRMVVTIATLFIVCFIPVMFSFTAKIIVPEYSFTGRYGNLYLIMFSFHFILESTNSSLNIFIYHRMSSNYRAVFQQMFGRNKSEK